MPALKVKIPELYFPFFPDIIEQEIPDEKIAICSKCTLQMSPRSKNKNTKCCVYYAELPNYLLGGLLQDERPALQAGKAVARRLIKEKMGVSPYGLRKPVWYKKKEEQDKKKPYDADTAQQQYEALRCPFYGVDGNCTTWAYREHCCSTYFCFSVGSESGKKFWNHFDQYLFRAEVKLARYVAQELGCTHSLEKDQLNGNALNADDQQKNIDQQKYAQLWQGWEGTEEAFFIAAYHLVKELSPEKFSQIIGKKMEGKIQDLEQLLHQFKDNLIPEKLKWNSDVQVEIMELPIVKLVTDQGEYKINMTKLPILQAFDGSKSSVDMAHLAYKADNSISQDISKLLEINVLTQASY